MTEQTPQDKALEVQHVAAKERIFALTLVQAAISIQATLNDRKQYHNEFHSRDVIDNIITLSLSATPNEIAGCLNNLSDEDVPSYEKQLELSRRDAVEVDQKDKELVRDGKFTTRALELLGIAAAFHDTGYTSTPSNISQGHEIESAKMARERMEQAGYSTLDVHRVMFAILSTQLQSADGKLEHVKPIGVIAKFLQDADVANFGKDSFSGQSDKVYEERENPEQTRKEFDEFTLVALLEPHHWSTPVALRILGVKKQSNIDTLRAKVLAN